VVADNDEDAQEQAEALARDGRVKFELETDASELLPGSDFGTSTTESFEVGDVIEARKPPSGFPQATNRATVVDIETSSGDVWLQVEFEGAKGYHRVSPSAARKVQ
jgi:hypothetical protein